MGLKRRLFDGELAQSLIWIGSGMATIFVLALVLANTVDPWYGPATMFFGLVAFLGGAFVHWIRTR